MKMRDFHTTASLLFALIAVVHLYRAFKGIPVTFDGSEVPMWASWIAAAVAGYMAYTAHKLK